MDLTTVVCSLALGDVVERLGVVEVVVVAERGVLVDVVDDGGVDVVVDATGEVG